MSKTEAAKTVSVFANLREQAAALETITDAAVVRNEFFCPTGVYGDLQSLADGIKKLLDDFSHRESDALDVMKTKSERTTERQATA